jgi:peptide/nickel transport system ATP-binding protein
MLLTVNNLMTAFCEGNFSFKAIDVTFDVENLEIIGLVGESGSGKTITALSLIRVLSKHQFSTGTLLFNINDDTVDLMEITQEQMAAYRGKEISYIFQEPMSALNPLISCGKQLVESILIHQKISKREARSKAVALLQRVELTDTDLIFNAYPFQLSAGQKQRVLIAMAICCNPKLLIADEPTTALDTLTQASILQLLKKLQSELGMSILYITHDLDVIASIAQMVLVIHKGSIFESGTVKEVYLNPQNQYTKDLMRTYYAKFSKVLNSPFLGHYSTIENTNAQIGNDSFRSKTEKNEIVLKVSNLKTHFNTSDNVLFDKNKRVVKAVDDVSFQQRRGETLGIIGLSGCGKTTIARSLIRLVEPTSGTIDYKDSEVTALDKFDLRDYRKKVQLIFQDPYASLNPKLKIGETLLEPMRVHKILKNDTARKEKVLLLLSKVNIDPEYLNRYPNELSGGQRQRIIIARALTLNPELIICDECVSALDIVAQAAVLNLLNDLKQEFNLTYIFISHDLNVVRFMSDRILVMNDGKITEEGTPGELFTNPKTDFTKKLIAAIPKKIIT